MDRIRIDLTHAYGTGHGLGQADLAALAPAGATAVRALATRREQDLRWLAIEHVSREHARILEWAEGLRGRFRALVVLGTGGGALPVIALRTALNSPFHNLTMPGGLPRLIVLDNVDPDLVGEFLDCVDPGECLFHVASGAGDTAETLAQFLLLRGILREKLGDEGHKERIAISTGVEPNPLRAIAEREGYTVFAIPEGVHARFAALSPVGLVPAALLGIDTPGLLAGAQAMGELCLDEDPARNPALAWAAACAAFALRGDKPIAVTCSYSHRLRDLAPWGAALVSEGLGKSRTRSGRAGRPGPTPVSAVGTTDQHAQLQQWLDGPRDKWITLLAVERPDHALAIPRDFEELEPVRWLGGHTLAELFAAERDATRLALSECGVPHLCVHFPSVNAHLLGQYFQFLQIGVALAAELLDLDLLATPALERASSARNGLLGRAGFEARRNQVAAWAARDPRRV